MKKLIEDTVCGLVTEHVGNSPDCRSMAVVFLYPN